MLQDSRQPKTGAPCCSVATLWVTSFVPGLFTRLAIRVHSSATTKTCCLFTGCIIRAWTTCELFLSWFHHSFLPEVEWHLQQKQIEFKVLLILDNAPRHPQSLQVLHEDVEVVFLSPNTTTVIWPMDQGVIKTFKANYSKHVIVRLHISMDQNPNLDIMQFWKKFTIADCLSVVEEDFRDVKP